MFVLRTQTTWFELKKTINVIAGHEDGFHNQRPSTALLKRALLTNTVTSLHVHTPLRETRHWAPGPPPSRRLSCGSPSKSFQLPSPAGANPGTQAILVLSFLLNASKKLESKVQQPSRSRCDLQSLIGNELAGSTGRKTDFTAVKEVIRKHRSA